MHAKHPSLVEAARIDEGGPGLRVRFAPHDPPALRNLGGGHAAACVLVDAIDA